MSGKEKKQKESTVHLGGLEAAISESNQNIEQKETNEINLEIQDFENEKNKLQGEVALLKIQLEETQKKLEKKEEDENSYRIEPDSAFAKNFAVMYGITTRYITEQLKEGLTDEKLNILFKLIEGTERYRTMTINASSLTNFAYPKNIKKTGF